MSRDTKNIHLSSLFNIYNFRFASQAKKERKRFVDVDLPDVPWKDFH